MTDKGFDFSSVNIIRFLWSNRKPILIISFLAGVISIIVSLTITPKFRSSVVFYPSVNQSVSSALFGKTIALKADALQFGGEDDVEQFLQILRSDYIREQVMIKYDLMNHYDIDKNSSAKYLKLNEMYDENISFKKTEFMSIEVSVLDTDPETAAFIARDIVALMDTTFNNMQKDVAKEALSIIEKEYIQLQKEIKDLEDTLSFIRDNGVYDVENQVGPLNEAYWLAIANNQNSNAKDIKKELNNLAKYGGTYQSLMVMQEQLNEQLASIRQDFMEAKVNVSQALPHKFIVNNAYPAEKKFYPKRSVIVIVSTFAAFLFSIFLILIIDTFKEAFKNE